MNEMNKSKPKLQAEIWKISCTQLTIALIKSGKLSGANCRATNTHGRDDAK